MRSTVPDGREAFKSAGVPNTDRYPESIGFGTERLPQLPHDARGPHATIPPMPDGATRMVIPRWIQLVGLPLLLLLVWALAHTLARVVFLFIVAGLIALLLNPLVRTLGRLWI